MDVGAAVGVVVVKRQLFFCLRLLQAFARQACTYLPLSGSVALLAGHMGLDTDNFLLLSQIVDSRRSIRVFFID